MCVCLLDLRRQHPVIAKGTAHPVPHPAPGMATILILQSLASFQELMASTMPDILLSLRPAMSLSEKSFALMVSIP